MESTKMMFRHAFRIFDYRNIDGVKRYIRSHAVGVHYFSCQIPRHNKRIMT